MVETASCSTRSPLQAACGQQFRGAVPGVCSWSKWRYAHQIRTASQQGCLCLSQSASHVVLSDCDSLMWSRLSRTCVITKWLRHCTPACTRQVDSSSYISGCFESTGTTVHLSLSNDCIVFRTVVALTSDLWQCRNVIHTLHLKYRDLQTAERQTRFSFLTRSVAEMPELRDLRLPMPVSSSVVGFQ